MFGKSLRRQTALVQLAKVRILSLAAGMMNSYACNTCYIMCNHFTTHCVLHTITSCHCCYKQQNYWYLLMCMFLHSQDARGVLRSSESVSCILNDWRAIDFETAAGQIMFSHQLPEHSLELFKECKEKLHHSNSCSRAQIVAFLLKK